VPDRQQPEEYFAGIDVSGANLRAVVVSFDGEVVERRDQPRQSEDLVPQIAQLASALREVKPIKSVGVGIPALVNRDTDRVLIGLPAAVSGDIHSELMKATGLHFELENDANAAAYGEYKAGAGRDANDLFYIGIGDWIGGAIILSGRLWIGASGCAGEVGHITIDNEGIECICGNTGCLETVAAAPNIVRRAQERLDRDSTSSLSRLSLQGEGGFTASDMVREALNGDDFSAMMIERTGKFIGTAVASVINLLSIERIVLGGPIMETGDLILKPIIEEAGKRSFQPCFEATRIVAAELGVDGVAIGAALLARDTA
jgi:glucokinase